MITLQPGILTVGLSCQEQNEIPHELIALVPTNTDLVTILSSKIKRHNFSLMHNTVIFL